MTRARDALPKNLLSVIQRRTMDPFKLILAVARKGRVPVVGDPAPRR